MIEKANNVITALGHGRKEFLESEEVLHGVLSKRIVTKIPIPFGTTITKNMIQTVVTKQAGGILPNHYYTVLGSSATKDMERNHILELGDFIVGS